MGGGLHKPFVGEQSCTAVMGAANLLTGLVDARHSLSLRGGGFLTVRHGGACVNPGNPTNHSIPGSGDPIFCFDFCFQDQDFLLQTHLQKNNPTWKESPPTFWCLNNLTNLSPSYSSPLLAIIVSLAAALDAFGSSSASSVNARKTKNCHESKQSKTEIINNQI